MTVHPRIELTTTKKKKKNRKKNPTTTKNKQAKKCIKKERKSRDKQASEVEMNVMFVDQSVRGPREYFKVATCSNCYDGL